MRAHVLQHVPFEGLGSIEPWLTARHARVTWTRFFDDPSLPDADDVDLLIALGGPMSVNDENLFPWLRAEKSFIARVTASGRPVLGICLGAQLIASTLGARVYTGPHKEIGWHPVYGACAELGSFAFPSEFLAFHWHAETFDLPPGAVSLASSDACKHQAFQFGRNVLGLQFHLETTPASLSALVERCRDELIAGGAYVQTEDALRDAPPQTYAAVNAQMSAVLDVLVSDKTAPRVPLFQSATVQAAATHAEETQASHERSASGSQSAYTIALCRGKGSCSFGLVTLEPIREAIETVIADSPWNAFVASARGGRIRPHDMLRIALSACPNGCSQPQIQDIGLIAALRPREVASHCTGCGLCEKTCREAAILFQDGRAVNRPETCLACGECARVCPAHAIICEPMGFRLLLGGRMGRHPVWATELSGLVAQEKIPDLFQNLLRLLLRESRQGEPPRKVLARFDIQQVRDELGECFYD
jgi:GMP synthase-like glutamine amidotransferase/ferredoxin